jgi:hypothetical protein
MYIHALNGIQAHDHSNEAATGNKELFFIISISLWQLFQRRINPALPQLNFLNVITRFWYM